MLVDMVRNAQRYLLTCCSKCGGALESKIVGSVDMYHDTKCFCSECNHLFEQTELDVSHIVFERCDCLSVWWEQAMICQRV